MANLSIRNLTIYPLELVSVERFEGGRVQTGNKFSNMTGAVTGFFNATDFPSHQTVAQGDARHKDSVSVHIEPFHIKQTEIKTADPKKEVIRLKFKTDNHEFETDVPSPSSKSATMKRLSGDTHELTAVYVPTGAFVAVLSSAKLNAWMKQLNNDWPLTMLSIPGTHNSPTCHKALPSVRCQAVSIKEQLQNGVRFLDVRVSCDPDSDKLALVHSAFPISLTGTKYFGDMLNVLYGFLEENPSETILLSVKREGTGSGTDAQLGKYLKYSYVDKNRDRWWTEPKIPLLGGARGRIVIIRRFALGDEMHKACWDGRGWGLDASRWPDNCEDGHCCDEHIRVQDFYEITESQNIQKKIDFSRGALERASSQVFALPGTPNHTADNKIPPFFVNFLSASNFFNAGCWPERIAAKVNPSIVEYLCIAHGEEGKGPKKLKVGSSGTGIVVTDWVGANDDWDLIRCIVGMNAKLQLKK